jgi:tRNA-splicing ligase RtcB (3'-phosphate/5'-hydroxy nucleic acid ligase)
MLKRLNPYTCIVEPTGAMLVPAKVYVSPILEEALSDGSLQQLCNAAALPGIVGASIAMPDVHIGYGFPVGGVAAFAEEGGIISPGSIGFDINCGVRLLTTNLVEADVKPLIEALFSLLERGVPAGTGKDSSIRLSHEELDLVLRTGSGWALSHGYAIADDIEKTEEHGHMDAANPAAVSHRAKDRGVNQLGTLGAGNHFLEVQVVDEVFAAAHAHAYKLRVGQVVVLIHCGSRGVGHQVCTDYVEKMIDAYPDIAASIPEKNLMYAPIASELGKQYYAAMAAAANFAWCNRQVITHQVRKAFERLFPGAVVELLYDVSHNIAKREEHVVDGEERVVYVHRKGATRSFGPGHEAITPVYRALGQPVLIPGSMGTASYVLAGAAGAMSETFGSCCHGAGRALSRTKALELLKGDAVRRALGSQGVHVQVRSVKGLAEEAPQAYKDVHEVIRVVSEAGLAVPVARLRPIGVLKG